MNQAVMRGLTHSCFRVPLKIVFTIQGTFDNTLGGKNGFAKYLFAVFSALKRITWMLEVLQKELQNEM